MPGWMTGLPRGWTYSNVEGYRVYHLRGESLMLGNRARTYESDSILQVAQWHVGGAVGFDVGANIGLFLLKVLAQSGEAAGKILGFEPNPATFARLQCTIERNRLQNAVDVFPLALSNCEGLSRFARHVGEHCCGDGFVDTGRAPSIDSTFVPTSTIDRVVSQLALSRLDWVKIDTEGAELMVLKGAADSLRRFRPRILFEAHPVNMAAYGILPDELYSLLAGFGYAIFDTRRRPLENAEFAEGVKKCVEDNFVALPVQ